jgi:BlaI family transcriptional regulator, penicillinase repressor
VSERISKSEHAVMEVLWAEAPLDASSIAERLTDAQTWTLTTVKTLLSRLVNKGAVDTASEGRKFLYRPAMARIDYVSAESKQLVDRLFGGKISPLVAHLAQHEALSPDDIAEIEALLKALKP